jgi:hypothetical protein
MPHIPLTHDQALYLVCAVCTNLRGTKPSQKVSAKVEELVQKYVFPAYRKGSPYYPQGICNTCRDLLQKMNRNLIEGNTEVKITFLLPESFHCELPHQTRKQAQEICSCRWCSLARLSGPKFLLWQKEMRELKDGRPAISRMCHSCGKGVPNTQKSHTCSASDVTIIRNMMQSIPMYLKGKLAHSLLQEQQEVQKGGAIVGLPPASGGRNLSVSPASQSALPIFQL